MFIFNVEGSSSIISRLRILHGYSSWSFCGMRISMCILIAMSSYLCGWIGICTAIIEQPSNLWSYAQL